MTETDAHTLATSEQAFVVAPAGCGKTELIAKAVLVSPGRSLVLTHTHAGVSALRERLGRYGVLHDRVEVQTIAGWALKYASAFPALSGLTNTRPSGTSWPAVYEAALSLLERKAVRDVVRTTFSGAYVDEYQDCNLPQHSIVLAIAEFLPCRLLGDPLQAIFDFNEPTVSWQNDVAPHFERLPDLTTPHRWAGKNPELGEWLMTIRPHLIAGETIDLRDGPLAWMTVEPANQRQACWTAARHTGQSVVAIAKWSETCHDFARSMNGAFSSMEELDCKALMDFARKMDRAPGHARAVLLLDFASLCFTTIGTRLSAIKEQHAEGRPSNLARLSTNRAIAAALNEVASGGNSDSLIAAIRELEQSEDAIFFRRELWQEMKTSVLTFRAGGWPTLEETAWHVRDRTRRFGRKSEPRVISRTLLVKGLEFDRSVVLDVDSPRPREALNAKEFYVAATRGSRGLTVLARESRITFGTVSNVLD